MKPEDKIKQALLYLAGRCDWARSEDGMGFNGVDAGFGHSLAERIEAGESLTVKQLHAALDMLWKYRESQLEPAGLELPDKSDLPDLDTPGTITINGANTLAVQFDYDPELVAAVKQVQGRRWNTEGKYWTIPIPSLPEAKEILPDFDVDPAAEEAFRNYEAPEEVLLPADRLEIDGDKLAIYFDYDPAKVKAVKKIVGRRWDKAAKRWTVPLTHESVAGAFEFAKEYGLTIPREVIDLHLELKDDYETALDLSKSAEADFEVEGLGGDLYPFQKAGVAYAVNAKRTFIADEMGLGKTVEALATIWKLEAFPALIVVPASVKLNWKREAEKWLPGVKALVIQGRDNGYDYSEYDLVIVNYDVLKDHAESLAKVSFEAVIFDESHYVKNHKAQRTEAAKELAKGIDVRLMLTGTPVLNRPQELLSQLNILGRLADLGGFWYFAKRYCQAYKSRWGWDFSGAAHLDELNEKMRAMCFIRRNKADVLTELPAKRRATVIVDIDNREEYQRAERDTIGWLARKAAEEKAFLESIAHLSKDERQDRKWERMHDKAYKAAQAEQLVRIGALKRLAAQGKLAAAKEWIADFLESGEKLVVFAHHVEIQDTLAEAFPQAAVIRGEDDPDTRQANVDRFQDDEDCQLIICSLKAGGVGITLTAASNVAFIELGWTPADMDQAEDRIHRIGQNQSVTAWYLLAADTIDEDIATLIEQKREVVSAATEGDQISSQDSILGDLIERLMNE